MLTAGRTSGPSSASGRESPHRLIQVYRDSFDLRITFDTHHRALFPEAAFLHTDPGHLHGKRAVIVHPDSTGLNPVSHPDSPGNVFCPDRSTEAECIIISFFDYFFFGRKLEETGNGTEYRLPMPPDGEMIQNVGVLPTITPSGAEGTRTPDLLRAKEALSQLSYSPIA